MTVIDLNSRRTRQNVTYINPNMSDKDAVQKYAEDCVERLWLEARNLRAIAGLSTALRVLGKIGFELGRKSCVHSVSSSASMSSPNGSKNGSEAFGQPILEPQKS